MDSAESENSKSNNPQSVFSTRSGIQDLLVRCELPVDGEQLPEAEKAEPESQTDPKNSPERKDKKGLNKSKRQIERVKRRQMNYLQERRAQKRRQVLFNRIRLLFKLCFAVLFAVLLWEITQSPLWIYQKPLFTLKENHLIQRAQIAPLVQNWVGKPIYAIHTGQLARSIQQRFAVADRVMVRRQVFPNQLEVLVTEKRPWAEIYTNEKQTVPYALLVPNGIINLRDYTYRSGLYGKQSLEKIFIPPHTVLTPKSLQQIREIAWQAHQVKGLHFNGLDARNQQRIVLRFQECPVILGAMNMSASERLSRLSPLVPKILELREALASVDLRWEEQVTFHKKPNVQVILAQEETEPTH